MRRNLHITSDRDHHPSSTTTSTTKQGTNRHCGILDDQVAEFSNNNFQQCASAASSTNGFNCFEEEDARRENAFKAVLVISLCISSNKFKLLIIYFVIFSLHLGMFADHFPCPLPNFIFHNHSIRWYLFRNLLILIFIVCSRNASIL